MKKYCKPIIELVELSMSNDILTSSNDSVVTDKSDFGNLYDYDNVIEC